jgi:hypothetical protein
VDDVETRIEKALAERDAALLEVARTREQMDALRLAQQSMQPVSTWVEPGMRPPSTQVLPLRYRLADHANDFFKTHARWAHQALRRLTGRSGV